MKLFLVLKYIPGYRSKTVWKMVIASIYYLIALSMINESLGQFLGTLSLPFVAFNLIDLIKHKKREIPLKKALISFLISFAVFGVAVGITPPENNSTQSLVNNNNTNLVNTENETGAKSSAYLNQLQQETIKGAQGVKDGQEEISTPVRLEKARVSRHVDGDTVYVQFPDGREEKVRFIGVNCPESTIRLDPYGKEASSFTKGKLFGKTIYMEKDVSDRDKYGRLLRYIWLEQPKEINEQEIRQKMFNAILLLEGYAQAATYPPDVKYVDYYTKLQREARENDKGLWGFDVNTTPNATPKSNTTTGTGQKVEAQYVGSSRSNKYHYPSCRWAKEIKPGNIVKFSSKSDAEGSGYVPCKVCKP